ncbi:hypothetical protein AYI69_g10657 [Smittium culicis]|uniref:Uncharacterized protein n=1 Tax=Smittium culicis TaxID=133412 RepID=A0A1R1X497_9FUNG|nr:hypothetical protein AYI69_g10657 [Smittium culicis]
MWTISQLEYNGYGSVTDFIFLLNANIIKFDAKHNIYCLERLCISPICTKLHSSEINEFDKARAFRRLLNIVLNEALRYKMISKEQKDKIRLRIVGKYIELEDRISVLREMSSVILMNLDEKLVEFSKYALLNIGVDWEQREPSNDDEECSLDSKKVYERAITVQQNQYLTNILDVKRLNIGLSDEEIGSVLELWRRSANDSDINNNTLVSISSNEGTRNSQNNNGEHLSSEPYSPRSFDNNKKNLQSYQILTKKKIFNRKSVSLLMLLHVLVYYSEIDLERYFFYPSYGDESYLASNKISRVAQIEEIALQAVMSFGLTWDLSNNPPKDLKMLCMSTLLGLGSVFSKLVVSVESGRGKETNLADLEEIDSSISGNLYGIEIFSEWFDICSKLISYEQAKKSKIANLLVYLQISSERLVSQKSEFNPELFLSLLLELLTEFRKMRPDYEPVVVYPNYSQNNRPSYEMVLYSRPSMSAIDAEASVAGNKKREDPKSDNQAHSPLQSLMLQNNKSKRLGVNRFGRTYESSPKPSEIKMPDSRKEHENFPSPRATKSFTNSAAAYSWKSDNSRSGGKSKSEYALDKLERESVGSEFDKLYDHVHKNFNHKNWVRGLIRTGSNKENSISSICVGLSDNLTNPNDGGIGREGEGNKAFFKSNNVNVASPNMNKFAKNKILSAERFNTIQPVKKNASFNNFSTIQANKDTTNFKSNNYDKSNYESDRGRVVLNSSRGMIGNGLDAISKNGTSNSDSNSSSSGTYSHSYYGYDSNQKRGDTTFSNIGNDSLQEVAMVAVALSESMASNMNY